MQVIDELTGKPIAYYRARRVVIGYNDDSGLVFGYVSRETPIRKLWFSGKTYAIVPSLFGEDNIVFSNMRGCYIAKNAVSEYTLVYEVGMKGFGSFPYSQIERRYEAVESFDIFKNNQNLLNQKDYLLSDFFPYTFGLEFETSQGYIPEDICFRDGLIPLRDGSIQGIEYSTVVLKGNEGLGLLEQQLNTLKKYTYFNKECSLHVHIGGFPLNTKSIYNLYLVCKKLEKALEAILPELTFTTRAYKANGKDYCKFLPSLRSFDQLYEYLVGRKFYGDFTQGHPQDISRQAKWRISNRYFWCNMINLLCYNVNKTVEFRMLRPSYNLEKITLWLYIFNAMMQFADKHMDGTRSQNFDLSTIISTVYPEEVAVKLSNAIAGLQVVKRNQSNNGDRIGSEIHIEDDVFKGNFGIIYK